MNRGSCLHVFHSYLLEDGFKFGYAGRLGHLDHVYPSRSIATEVTLIRLLDYAYCILLIEDANGFVLILVHMT